MSENSYWKNLTLDYEPKELAGLEKTDMDYFVIDDFFDDPDAVRGKLLNLSYEPPPNPKRGVISFNTAIPESIYYELFSKIKTALNKNIEFHPRSKCAATYKSVPTNSVCHVDGADNMTMFNWTVVIYMNTPDQCQGGTLFYKHLPTGHIYNKDGVHRYGPDFRDKSKWKLLGRADMKYNRALFCPGWRFHSIDYTFGDSIKNARLTINPKIIAY